ncbi:MAG: NAD-binding protein [Bacilli bacterium]|nr:NAD-binding protein [Bacilli bacterium]
MLNAIIVGGDKSTDYIIKTFINNNIPFIVVNGNREVAEYLSKNNNIEVYYGPTNKLSTYQDLNLENIDLVVAMEKSDVKNYTIVALLKKYFDVKRSIAIVNDPDNLEAFHLLGVDVPISNSYLLAQSILNDSNIHELTKRVTIENGEISIIEITLRPYYKIVGQTLMEIKFPVPVTVCAVCRKEVIIVPNGGTRFLEGDRLIISLFSKDQHKIIKFIKR